MTAKEQWDSMTWQENERFLKKHGFALGWSSHTWRYLDRSIQVSFEENREKL